MRIDGRNNEELRPISLTPGYVDYPEGSVLITMGKTRLLCNVSIGEGVPRWMQLQGLPGGWITAEYGMLPRSTHTRTPRESGGPSGRTQEIRRLIGRSLRAAVDLSLLGPRTLTIDCDVIQADGGTRTAAISGGYVALALALKPLILSGQLSPQVMKNNVAAVSVGVVDGEPMLDLSYTEDSKAEVDVNVVMTDQAEFIEVQGTAEGAPFSRTALDRLLELAYHGITELFVIQGSILNP